MSRIIALTLLTSAALAAADVKDVNRTVSLSPNGSVTLVNHKGSIHVTTWDRAEVEIHARIQAAPGEPMDHRRFEGTEVKIDTISSDVHIETSYPDDNSCCFSDNGSNPEILYTIRMPRTARLTIRDHRSETHIADLAGALDIDTHRGTVRVERLSGALKLTTHRGDVDVQFAAFTGASSVETHSGTIELALPRSSRFDVQAESGKRALITSDFPMVMQSASRKSENMHGSVNGGGPSLEINTYSGHVRLRSL